MSSSAPERCRAELVALALIQAALDVASAALIVAHPERICPDDVEPSE